MITIHINEHIFQEDRGILTYILQLDINMMTPQG